MAIKVYPLTRFNASESETDFKTVYRTELPRVHNFFRHRVGDGQIAKDLTADTSVKAWRNRDQYRRDLFAFSTWLFTISRAQDNYRKSH